MSDELVIKADAVNAARRELMDADIALFEAEADLKSSECLKWIDGVPGKNADERAAFMRADLTGEHIALQKAKIRQMTARCAYDIASQNLRLQRDLLELSRRVEG